MRTITIKKGFSSLLLVEAAIICIVTVLFMLNLYHLYTNFIYNESVEVLSLYSVMAENKLAQAEDVSFEMLSNRDIQKNLLIYNSADSPYEKHTASNSLYTQLFTRWVMNRSLISINFIYPDGRHIATAERRALSLTEGEITIMTKSAHAKRGSCGWAVNVAGENTVTLYRVINDISGKGFKPQGVLIMHIDAKHLLRSETKGSELPPQIVAVAEGHVLFSETPSLSSDEIISQAQNADRYSIITNDSGQFLTFSATSRFNGWIFMYILPKYKLISQINDINIIYAGIFIAVVLIILLIGLKMAESISKPIAKLTEAMQEAEKTNYSADSISELPQSSVIISEVQELNTDFRQMISKIDYLINEDYAKQLMILNMKYKMLQQQINPHFLYNVLDTINWKSIEVGSKEISVMVMSLSKLLRNSIRLPDVISVKEDLKIVEDYITIQKIRFEERLEFISEITPEIGFCRIPRLTLQPIVENCIIHNIEKFSKPCKIVLTSAIIGNRVEISVIDNGIGIEPSHIESIMSGREESKTSGIGLKNVHERVKISFGSLYGVSVENAYAGGTKVTICIPFIGEKYAKSIDS